jgi:phage replication O-like protein O
MLDDHQPRLPLEPITGPPRYTQVPNRVLDEWMPHLNRSELRVALAIVRLTLGWHRNAWQITTRRLAQHCNLSPRAVRRATAALADAGVIRIEPQIGCNGQEANTYHLVWRTHPVEDGDDT